MVLQDKNILPEFPRTKHLSHKPNAVRDDLVAPEVESAVIFNSDCVYVEDKVDGANCAMMLFENRPIVRNRSHILNKGFLKDTPAKLQFRPIWGWFYKNKKLFANINKAIGGSVGIYGEWCHSTHGSEYDLLPELFIAYDIYDPDAGKFFDTKKTRRLLMEVGFCVPQLLHEGPVKNWEQLEKFCNEPSPFSSKDKREGIYVKVSDGAWIVNRYKMVRSGFVQGCKWSDQYLTKNKLVKN